MTTTTVILRFDEHPAAFGFHVGQRLTVLGDPCVITHVSVDTNNIELRPGQVWTPTKGARVKSRTLVWVVPPPHFLTLFSNSIGWVHDPAKPRWTKAGVDSTCERSVMLRWIQKYSATVVEP